MKSPSDHNLSSLPSFHDEVFEYRDHVRFGYEKMENYFIHNQLTDITLHSGEKIINAHKIVLCAASEYFAIMFTGKLCESVQKEVKFHEMDGDILQKLIHYCYTGKIEIHEDTVEMILTTASLLQLCEVTDACCKFLKKQLHPSNSIGIGMFADIYNCSQLKEVSHQYTADHFMEVIQHQEFLNLPENELCILLSSDDLNVPTEEDIFNSLMKWIDHKMAEREKNIGELLALVRLPLLEPSFIVDHVETEHKLRNNPICQRLIMEAMKYHLLPERRQNFKNCCIQPRKSTIGVLYAIGGSDFNKGNVSIEEYNLRDDSWTIVGSMSSRRLQFGAAVIEDKLYIVGGRDGLKTLNTAECLDLKTMSWISLPSMTTSRHGLGVTVLGGPLYAVGGHDGWSYLNTVERWDPDSRQWNNVAQMSLARSTAGVAVLNDKLYVVGGRDSSSCLKSVEKYDPHTNKWIMCSSMIKRRGAAGIGVLNGFLYVVGGHDSPASIPCSARFECVERYDPRTDSWTVIASMSVGRDFIGVGVLGSHLFAVGGYDNQNYLTLVEMYDPTENTWRQVCPLKTGRAGTCVVTVKKKKE